MNPFSRRGLLQRRTDGAVPPSSLHLLDVSHRPLDLSTTREVEFMFQTTLSSSPPLQHSPTVRKRMKLSASLATVGASEECAICKEEEQMDRSVVLPCMHTFCYACITRWVVMKANCPLCKGDVERLVHAIRSDTQFKEVSVEQVRLNNPRYNEVINLSEPVRWLVPDSWSNE